MAGLRIISYKKNSSKIFEKEKQKIAKTIGIDDIHHIGSTAVPGLGGRGIVDIMIGIKNWKEARVMVKKLKKNRIWPCSSQKAGKNIFKQAP